MNTNMRKMMRLMTEQFYQLASSSREPDTFSNQPVVNSKGLPSSSGPPSNDNVRKLMQLYILDQVERLTIK